MLSNKHAYDPYISTNERDDEQMDGMYNNGYWISMDMQCYIYRAIMMQVIMIRVLSWYWASVQTVLWCTTWVYRAPLRRVDDDKLALRDKLRAEPGNDPPRVDDVDDDGTRRIPAALAWPCDDDDDAATPDDALDGVRASVLGGDDDADNVTAWRPTCFFADKYDSSNVYHTSSSAILDMQLNVVMIW